MVSRFLTYHQTNKRQYHKMIKSVTMNRGLGSLLFVEVDFNVVALGARNLKHSPSVAIVLAVPEPQIKHSSPNSYYYERWLSSALYLQVHRDLDGDSYSLALDRVRRHAVRLLLERVHQLAGAVSG